MNRKLLAAIIIVMTFLLVVSIVSYYYLTNQTHSDKMPIQSVSDYYLQYDDNTSSRVFVVSANATYGNYPGATVTTGPYPTESVIAESGEPCVIINVTLRNDYTTLNPAPNPVPLPNYNSTLTHIALTTHLFIGETQINAKDITNAFPLDLVFTNRAFTSLNYGESTILSIYLATNETEITSFQLIPYYVGLAPPP